MVLPFVSINLVTFNSEKTIDNCLKSIFNLDYPRGKMEVVVADGGSTDGTLEILKRYRVKVISCEGRRIGECRQIALEESTGEVIVLTDSDVEVGRNWLRKLVETLNELEGEGVVGVGGPDTGIITNTVSRYIDILPVHVKEYHGLVITSDDPMVISACNAAYKREALKEVGGFNRELNGAEDVEINWKLLRNGYKLAQTPEACIRHRRKETIKSFVRQRIRNSAGLGYICAQNKGLARLNWFLPSVSLILTFVFLWLVLKLETIQALTLFTVYLAILIVVGVWRIKSVGKEIKALNYPVLLFLFFLWMITEALGFIMGFSISLIRLRLLHSN